MPILHSFEENKLEYEDEDEVKIKIMGTEMDKESLEHNLYENDIILIVCHNFSPASNTPIKPKDSGSFRMKVFSTWMVFRENTHDLDSFGEETDKITDLHQILKEVLLTKRGDGITRIKRCYRDVFSADVWNLEMASGRGQLKEDLESSTLAAISIVKRYNESESLRKSRDHSQLGVAMMSINGFDDVEIAWQPCLVHPPSSIIILSKHIVHSYTRATKQRNLGCSPSKSLKLATYSEISEDEYLYPRIAQVGKVNHVRQVINSVKHGVAALQHSQALRFSVKRCIIAFLRCKKEITSKKVGTTGKNEMIKVLQQIGVDFSNLIAPMDTTRRTAWLGIFYMCILMFMVDWLVIVLASALLFSVEAILKTKPSEDPEAIKLFRKKNVPPDKSNSSEEVSSAGYLIRGYFRPSAEDLTNSLHQTKGMLDMAQAMNRSTQNAVNGLSSENESLKSHYSMSCASYSIIFGDLNRAKGLEANLSRKVSALEREKLALRHDLDWVMKKPISKMLVRVFRIEQFDRELVKVHKVFDERGRELGRQEARDIFMADQRLPGCDPNLPHKVNDVVRCLKKVKWECMETIVSSSDLSPNLLRSVSERGDSGAGEGSSS
nr:hypothetical protein [Tanacetum cinerariifolium]